MKAKIVRVGNSKGVRIPKSLLEHSGIDEDVELEAKPGSIMIKASGKRQGWAEAFKAMASSGEDALLDGELSSNWDKSEWHW